MYFCILQRYFSSDSKIPVLIVGNKADMNAVRQDYILQPEAFCAKHRVSIFRCFKMMYLPVPSLILQLPPPQMVSCAAEIKKDIYIKLATMAAFP